MGIIMMKYFSRENMRLITGMIMIFYLFTHLLNHAMGMFSLEFLGKSQKVFLAFWRNPVTSWLVVVSVSIHFLYGLDRIFSRKAIKLKPSEVLQYTLAIIIPILLYGHIAVTFYLNKAYDWNDSYSWIYSRLDTLSLIGVILTLLICWIHGSLGVYFWMRFKPWYPRLKQIAFSFALLMPTLAIIGVLIAHGNVQTLAAEPGWLDQLNKNNPLTEPQVDNMLNTFVAWFSGAYVISLALLFSGRWFRTYFRLRKKGVTIIYPSGEKIRVPLGMSILEASLTAGIPHAYVCGGKGRCSTCRVQVAQGTEFLSPKTQMEIEVLNKIGAAENIRLACQTQPIQDISVSPMLGADADANSALQKDVKIRGAEMNIAVLFADLRGFTKFSEHRLPYDVVYILNEYFKSMGKAIEESGGYLDKFIGDGVMALFGTHQSIEEGCKSALVGAAKMIEMLEALNEYLKADLKEPLRIGIGIHCGSAIVGEMGYSKTTSLTAIGDVVNTASRLQSLTKDYKCQLVISEDVSKYAGLMSENYDAHEIKVRGKSTQLNIFSIKDARAIAFTKRD